MGKIDVTCSNCGETVQLDDSRTEGFCNYCGSKIYIKDLSKDKPSMDNKDSRLANYNNMLGVTLMTISLITIIVSILLVIPMMAFRPGHISSIIVFILLGSLGYYIGKRIKNK